MAYNPPTKNVLFKFAIALQDMANPGTFKVTPTLAAGDFKVDIDGAGFNNLGTLPTVTPSGTCRVAVTLSAGEMNGDVITFKAVDATATKEWADLMVVIETTA